MIINIINPKAKIIQDPKRLRPEKSEVQRLFGSNKKLKELTKWKQNYSLEMRRNHIFRLMRRNHES